MPTMTVTTGVQFAEWSEPHTLTIPIDGEIDPDAVFHAANRIEGVEQDCSRLAHEWQRELRRQLDSDQAPSMSVKDTIEIKSDQGVLVGRWICLSFGWAQEVPQ